MIYINDDISEDVAPMTGAFPCCAILCPSVSWSLSSLRGVVFTPSRARGDTTLVPPPTASPRVLSQSVDFPASAAITVSGRLYGAGTRGVILSNEGDNISSHWASIAEHLAAA